MRPFFAFSVRGGGNDRTFAHCLGFLRAIARAQGDRMARPPNVARLFFFGRAVVLGLALRCGFSKVQQKTKTLTV